MGQTALSESLRGVEAEIAAQQPERALMLSQEVQARFPRALAVQRVTGEVYLALRKTREAIGALDRALGGDPEDARACCARAIVQQIQGDSMGALAWYRRACDIRPGDTVLRSAYRELARSLNQPAYEPSRTGLARLYLRGDLFPHALREWETVLVEQPDALDAQLGLAETLWRAGNTQGAADRCRRLLLNAPSCVKALLILAAIEHDAGRDDEARNSLRRAAELDPDMRIARELYAERVAANDRMLSLLAFGEEPSVSRTPSVPLAPSRLSEEGRVAAPSRPGARLTTGAAGQPPSFALPTPPGTAAPSSAPITGALTSSAAPHAAHGAAVASAPVSGPSNLPPDFHRIFSETKNMLWGDDAEAQETQGRVASAPPFDRSRVDSFGRSQAVMPPLISASGAPEDTEARLSMNFLGWLHAQGALAQDEAARGSAGTTGPVPVPLPSRAQLSNPLSGELRYDYGYEMATGPLPTGPLPPPSSEALKAMFAELEPEAASSRIVDALPLPETPPDAATPVWSDANAEAAGWIVGAFAQNELERRSEVAAVAPSPPEPDPASVYDSEKVADGDERRVASENENPPDALWTPEASQDEAEIAAAATTDFQPTPAGESAAITLEALEQGLAQSGFQSYELRPGELASLLSQTDEAAASEQAPLSAPSEDVRTDVLEPVATKTDGRASVAARPPEPEPEPARPAPDDYAGRLSLARARRASGSLDDALGEYRIILKNAPDLLGDVMGELHESLVAAPDHPEVHRLLGDAHIRQGDYLSALESYNRAVALTQAQGS